MATTQNVFLNCLKIRKFLNTTFKTKKQVLILCLASVTQSNKNSALNPNQTTKIQFQTLKKPKIRKKFYQKQMEILWHPYNQKKEVITYVMGYKNNNLTRDKINQSIRWCVLIHYNTLRILSFIMSKDWRQVSYNKLFRVKVFSKHSKN